MVFQLICQRNHSYPNYSTTPEVNCPTKICGRTFSRYGIHLSISGVGFFFVFLLGEKIFSGVECSWGN